MNAMMLRLALRNVFRHRVRTAITLAAIVSGVVGLILSGGFVHDIFFQLGEAVIHSQSGHIQIAKAGFQVEGTRKPDQFLIRDGERLRSRIRSHSGVSEVTARVSFSGLLNNGRSDLPIIGEGIEPDLEAKLGTSLRIVEGRRLTDKDPSGVMLGSGAAQSMRLAPGDHAVLIVATSQGATNTLDVDVVGIFQTYSKDYDARAVKLPLAAASAAMDTEGINTIVVLLEETSDTAELARILRAELSAEGLEVWSWQELNDFYSKTLDLYDTQFGVLRLIILVMVLLSVVNSVNISLFERTAEFGTMRALGNRSRSIFLLVATETFLLGLIGAVAGVLLGALLALAISAVGIPMPPPPNADIGFTARIQLVPVVIAGAFVTGLLATTFAGMVSALRIARTPVVDALRQSI